MAFFLFSFFGEGVLQYWEHYILASFRKTPFNKNMTMATVFTDKITSRQIHDEGNLVVAKTIFFFFFC